MIPNSRTAVTLPGSISTISKGAGSKKWEAKPHFCFPLVFPRLCFSWFFASHFPLFASRLFTFKWLLGLFARRDQPVRLFFDAMDQRIQLGNEDPQLLKVAFEQVGRLVNFGSQV